MGMGCQLAQCQLSPIERITLGTKCGVAQTRGVLPGAGRGLMWRPAVRPTAPHAIVSRTTRTVAVAKAGTVFSIAKLATAPRHNGLGLFHARTVIAPHRHHRLDQGFSCWFFSCLWLRLGWRLDIAVG